MSCMCVSPSFLANLCVLLCMPLKRVPCLVVLITEHSLSKLTTGKNRLWSVVDLKDAFNQIPLAEITPWYAATSTSVGMLRPQCMQA